MFRLVFLFLLFTSCISKKRFRLVKKRIYRAKSKLRKSPQLQRLKRLIINPAENEKLGFNLEDLISKGIIPSKDIFFDLDGSIRLAGQTELPFMGRVEIYRRATEFQKPGWGVLCGKGFSQNEAVVMCRQLGYTQGRVIAIQRGGIFGDAVDYPVMGTKIACKGHEKKILDCPGIWLHEQNDTVTDIPCPEGLRSAAVVCSCDINSVENSSRPQCYASVKPTDGWPIDNFYCRSPCKKGYHPLGKSVSYCYGDSESVDQPRCVEEKAYKLHMQNLDKPCFPNPCQNNGTCSVTENSYKCSCTKGFAGKNCKIQKITDCGVPKISTKPQVRIIGGQPAFDNQWPWMVQIKFKGKFICGASLIAPDWALTAAHCGVEMRSKMRNLTAQNDDWTLVLGENSQMSLNVFETKISLAVLHDFTNIENDMPRKDIALLRLDKPVKSQTENIKFLCLPENDDDGSYEGDNCSVAGWGKTEPNLSVFPTWLQWTDLYVYPNKVCRMMHTEDFNYKISDHIRTIDKNLITFLNYHSIIFYDGLGFVPVVSTKSIRKTPVLVIQGRH